MNENFCSARSQPKGVITLSKRSGQGGNIAWPRQNAYASERSPYATLVWVHTYAGTELQSFEEP